MLLFENDLADEMMDQFCELIYVQMFFGMLENLGNGIQVDAPRLVEKICPRQKFHHITNHITNRASCSIPEKQLSIYKKRAGDTHHVPGH